MKKKDLAELEVLKQVVEAGDKQLRRTFDMYLELLDKVNGNGRQREQQQTGIEANV